MNPVRCVRLSSIVLTDKTYDIGGCILSLDNALLMRDVLA